ncbi:MAG: lamin tail domain-containing protein [Anaerolineae bacterium]
MSRCLTFLSLGFALAWVSGRLTDLPQTRATNLPAMPLDMVIHEVAWGGTAASSYDEWIELYNNTAEPIDLAGWTLEDRGDIHVTLDGVIPAHGYFLLERTDDTTVNDIQADFIYTGGLNNAGERLELWDPRGMLIDAVDGSGGWPAGSGSPDCLSMERLNSSLPDTPSNWASNNGMIRNGVDANNARLNGTPKARNSVASASAELWLQKSGPERVQASQAITYTLMLGNYGNCTAAQVQITDYLPVEVRYLYDTAPYSQTMVSDHILVWLVGDVPAASTGISFTLTGWVEPDAIGPLTNQVIATSISTETTPADNRDAVETLVHSQPSTPAVLIDALYYDGYASDDADEAFRLINVSAEVADISGWRVTNQALKTKAIFPNGTTLAPGQAIWCSRKATSFEQQFGFKPDFETDDTDPTVAEMGGAWPAFANDGGQCRLQDALLQTIDLLVYEGGNPDTEGWTGPAVQPWTPSNLFGAEGQVLYRKRDQFTGLPVLQASTQSLDRWAQDPDDSIDGRKVQYPGWDLDQFFWTAQVTETAVLTVAVGPDHLLDTMLAQLERAQTSIWIEGYTFESATLAHVLTQKLAAGVSVTVLLEGGPVGGIQEAQRWVCGQLQDAGGRVYFFYNGPVHSRYRFQHAKFILIDDRVALIGSENLNPSSFPADDKADGTAGRRGAYLITDAPGVVDRVRAILRSDLDPAHHLDLATCQDVPTLCLGAPPPAEPNWMSYTVAFSAPLTIQGILAFEVVQSPENSLRTVDGLLGLIGRAGEGDTLLMEQFYEAAHWGPGTGTPSTDPNPRLTAILEAARRGATVRVLLDSHFDQDGENATTVAYLQKAARTEGLDLGARLGDPTYLGLHNKMVLAEIEGRGYVHVGSLNGTEVSFKANRELALLVQSDEAYQYLKRVFESDWRASTPPVYLPLITKGLVSPQPAAYGLIGEAYYAVSKEDEWVEIVNPTNTAIDLSTYKIGDAQRRDAYEGMYRFPPGAILPPHRVLVIAASAASFCQSNPGRRPDFEVYETDPTVPTLQPYPLWGTGDWHLNNAGDEILLLDSHDRPVDVLVYGTGTFPGVIPHPGVSVATHSLERFPYLFDTNDCSIDFRDWPFPNPGVLP